MTTNDETDDDLAVRDFESGLVAALQESDTAVETLHDGSLDRPRTSLRRRRAVGLAGLVLAALALVVARRRW